MTPDFYEDLRGELAAQSHPPSDGAQALPESEVKAATPITYE